MTNIASLIIYLSTYLISALLLKYSKVRRNNRIDWRFILAVAFPVLLAAFRVNVGTDYNNYVIMYQTNSKLSIVQWFTSNRGLDDTRLGIWLVSRIAGVFDTSKVFFGLLAFLSFFPVAYAVKKDYSTDSSFFIVFYFLLTTFSTGLNICKQAVAIGWLFFGLRYVHKRKFVRYCLTVLVASLFHITAAIGIIIYFLGGKRVKPYGLGDILGFACVGLGLFFIPTVMRAIGGRFGDYFNYEGLIANRGFFIDLVWVILFAVLSTRLIKFDSKNKALISCMIIGLLLGLFGFYSPYIKRIGMYFMFTQGILMGQLPQTVAVGSLPVGRKRKNSFVAALCVIYSVALFIFTYMILGQSEIFPYGVA